MLEWLFFTMKYTFYLRLFFRTLLQQFYEIFSALPLRIVFNSNSEEKNGPAFISYCMWSWRLNAEGAETLELTGTDHAAQSFQLKSNLHAPWQETLALTTKRECLILIITFEYGDCIATGIRYS